MRISGGHLRGQTIECPRGLKTRPTSGRLKKTLFDILAPRLPGARVLDLFSGAGALGLEALSRGASQVVFVERSRVATGAMERNLIKLGLVDQGEVLRRGVLSSLTLLETRGKPFDFILLDPPYHLAVLGPVLEKIGASSLLALEGSAIVEHHHKRALAVEYGKLRRVREARAGESCLTFYSLPSCCTTC